MHIYWKCFIPGVIAAGLGVFVLLGIWFPRIRSYHKGSPVRLGPISCAAAALIPLVWGLMLIGLSFYPKFFEKLVLLFVVSFVLGIGGSIYGAARDFRADKKDAEKSKTDSGDWEAGS